jgi:hypothetical protein
MMAAPRSRQGASPNKKGEEVGETPAVEVQGGAKAGRKALIEEQCTF